MTITIARNFNSSAENKSLDSVNALIASRYLTGEVYLKSYRDGWQGTLAGPKGGHYVHTTGATNLLPSVGAPATAGTIGTGVQAGYYWDKEGKEWALSKSQPVFVSMFDAQGNNVANDTTAIANAVGYMQGEKLTFDDGTYINDSVPSGIDNITLLGTARVFFNGTKLPVLQSIFAGDKQTALISGVIRYYTSGASGAGWYMLVDQLENHDPILCGPVSASGSQSVIIEININDFGLDVNDWTPSGFVCGPDETLAQNGVVVGASVGSTTFTIQGSINAKTPELISSNGTTFSGSSSRYTYSWINEGAANARLLVTKNPAAASSFIQVGSSGFSPWPVVTSRQTNGSGGVRPIPSLASIGDDGMGNTQYEISFWSLVDGSRVTAQSTSMQFWLHDPSIKTRIFIWDDVASAIQSTSNIWFVGAFVRKPASL